MRLELMINEMSRSEMDMKALGDQRIIDVLGETGGTVLPIYDELKKNTKIKLLMLGPLTNLAKALISFPEISLIIDEVIIMGGAFFTEGNATQYAEFNIYADAEAASVVFNSKLNIRVVGLDVCNNLVIDKNKFYNNEYSFLKSNTKSSKFSKDIIDSFFKYHKGKNVMALCDPIATICLIEKDLFSYKNCSVKVVTEGSNIGQTIPNTYAGGLCGNSTPSFFFILHNIDIPKPDIIGIHNLKFFIFSII